MPDSKDVQRWIQYAKEDYQAALLVLSSYPRNASFDLQQSAEKYLKAVLIALGREPDRTHDLVILFQYRGGLKPSPSGEGFSSRACA